MGRRTHRAALLIAFALGLAIWAPSASGSSEFINPHYAHQNAARGGGSTSPLADHGGPVIPTSHTYAIFWGPQSAWSSDVPSGIANLFSGFTNSRYLGTAQQYLRGAAVNTTFVGTKFDASAPPSNASPSDLGAEVGKLYGASLDPTGIYFVYTSNFPSGTNFCAWHSNTSVAGTTIAVAYMPNTTGVSGCDGGNQFGGSYSQGLYTLANVSAHEFIEAVTDPLGSAWFDRRGQEIADKCAWTFTGGVTLSNGSIWQLQREWSNAAGGCVQAG